MIATQTAKELGFDLRHFKGTVMVEVEPKNPYRGEGLGKTKGMEHLSEKVAELFGNDWIVNSQIDIRRGTSHPSYGTYRLLLIGDRYDAKAAHIDISDAVAADK